MLTYEEATKLATDFLSLRDKLSKENTVDLKIKYKKSQKEVVAKLSYLVDMVVARYRKFPNYDDLRQDGLEALMCAFESFKPGMGDFVWWAKSYIKTRISRCANKHSTVRIPLKKCKEMTPYKTTGMPIIIDEENNADKIIEKRESASKVEKLLDFLPDTHKEVVKLYIYENMTLRNIAKQLKIKRVDAENIFNESMKTLKEREDLLEE